MNEKLLKDVEHLAGPQRAKTFRAAAEWILKNNCKCLAETGCFRGTECDGMSTLIFAKLANETGGFFFSFDVSQSHIDAAEKLIATHDLTDVVDFVRGDSVVAIAGTLTDFIYLDSFDHDPNNPGPCQRHQLAEVGAIYSTLSERAAILLDDVDKTTGGKTLLSAAFLKDRGWTLACESELQLLFTR